MCRVLGHRGGVAVAVLTTTYCVSAWRFGFRMVRPAFVHYYNQKPEAICAAQLLTATGFDVDVYQVVVSPQSGRRSLVRVVLAETTTSAAAAVGIDEEEQ